MSNNYMVQIAWGQCPTKDNLTKHEFETQKELDAFMLGVQAAEGWLDYECLVCEDDFNSYDYLEAFYERLEAE